MKISKPSPNLSRNDFDMSHRFLNTMNFGELLPTLCLETVPDDYFEIKASNLVRAIPMVSSPFLRAKQHIDLWFVPYSDLWHNFNQFIVGRKDPLGASFNDYRYCPRANYREFVGGVNSVIGRGDTDIVGRDFYKGAVKIFNLLGYGSLDRLRTQMVQSQVDYPDFNLWRVLAYNKIWYDEYRNKYYDDGSHMVGNSVLTNVSKIFNVDDLSCATVGTSRITGSDVLDRLVPMFQMRYRQWKKDLFTGLLPSTQFGAVSTVESLQGITRLSQFGLNTSLSSGVILGTSQGRTKVQGLSGTGVTGTGDSVAFTPTNYQGNPVQLLSTTSNEYGNGFDVLALRKSEAIQKWRQIALLSGNSAYDNMRGHYGVTPDHDRDHRPTYIGSVDAPLQIGDINASAETGQSGNEVLGSVAGKGLSSLDEKVFKFKANDFGVIMGISSLLPEAEYECSGVDRLNQLLESDDYFKPEYQNLGLEAVGSYDFLVEDNLGLSVLGYAPRYYGYKQKLDKVTDKYRHTGGQFRQWASPKYDILSTLGMNHPLAGLYVNPALYNVNFVADVDTSDQFMNDQYWDIKAVRPMSELGLAQF